MQDMFIIFNIINIIHPLMSQSPIYDWSNVSPAIKYIATDRCGRAYGYTNKPIPFKTYGKWTSANFLPEEQGGVIIDKSDNPFNGLWFQSLEKRPKA